MNKLALTFTLLLAALGVGCVTDASGDDSSSAALTGDDPAAGDPTKPPPPPPCGGPRCFTDVIGDAKACVPLEGLHKGAVDFCMARKAKVAHFAPLGDCAKGSASIAKFTCCAPPPPPPPPNACHGEALPPLDACVDTAKLHEAARAACGKEILTGFHPDLACGESGSKGAKYVCCAPPPPPPGPMGEPPKEPPPALP